MEDQILEPLNSPFSKVYLSPKTEQIINCAIGLKHPIDINSIKKAFSNSIILSHLRFSSLMVKDQNDVENWRKTNVNIDDHVIVHPNSSNTNTRSAGLKEDYEDAINSYLADISVSNPLSQKKPLWEVHVLMGLQCVVFRMHHALGDGAFMMSLLSTCFGENTCDAHKNGVKFDKLFHEKNRSWKEKTVWGFVKSIWFTLVFGLRLLGKVLCVNDNLSVISGGDGVELWPRELVTLNFKVEDFQLLKKAIPFATINDVLLGVISCGLSKYLQFKSPQDLLHGLHVTGMVLVNLRKQPILQERNGSFYWGNKTGIVLQPIRCSNGLNPLDHVRNMKATMDQKKQSYEAQLSYKALELIATCFGPKAASWCSHRVLCSTTMLISNIMGPLEKLVIDDNPVTYLRVNISSLPHAITMHMVSYGGNLDVQVMVAKDVIDDPKFMAKCFQDSLSEMKNCICDCSKDNMGVFSS